MRAVSCLAICAFAIAFIYTFRVHPFYGFATAFVLWKMAVEDFRFHTIDKRWLLALCLLLFLPSPNPTEFLASSCMGLLPFQAVYYLSVRVRAQEDSRPETEQASGMGFGYVPVFSAALLAYLWWRMVCVPDLPGFLVPVHEGFALLRQALSMEAFLAIFAAGAALCALAEAALQKAARRGMAVSSGLGDGDPKFLAVFAGALGMEQLMAVVFLSAVFAVPYAGSMALKKYLREGFI